MGNNQLNGECFENDIRDLINSTSLRNFSYHQLKLQVGKETIIPDHLIILPHKVVIIESKFKEAKDIKVFNKYDAIQVKGFTSNKVFDSVVQQVVGYKEIISEVLNQSKRELTLKNRVPFEIYRDKKGVATISEMVLDNLPFAIDVYCCIKSEGATVTSYQTQVPMLTPEALSNYLKAWETELRFYPKDLIDQTFEDRSELLFNYVDKKEGKTVSMDKVLNY